MPPLSFLGPMQSAQRRPAGNAKSRENKTTQPVPNAAHRSHKTHSPDALEEGPSNRNDTGGRKKKRSHNATSITTPIEMSLPQHSAEDQDSTRGRKNKSKSRAPSLFAEEGNNTLVLRELLSDGGPGTSRSKRKERSKSRETSCRSSMKTPSESSRLETESLSMSGNDSHYQLMLEVEILRKQLLASKRTIQKQSKIIDELRIESASSSKLQQEQSKEMKRLRDQLQKSDELVSCIESNMTCQICMELLSRPNGLSPCGHVLCEGCLQSWFRAAPSDDDILDDVPDRLLYLDKTCPCCRAIIHTRPIPLFVVKSLASALGKAKASPDAPRVPSPLPNGDPWAGIFPEHSDDDWSDEDSDDDMDVDEDEDYDEDDDEDDGDNWEDDWYGSPNGEEHYAGPYVRPRWAPPSEYVTREDYAFLDDLADEELAILRRGATLQMIDIFAMDYTHDHGLSARLDGNTVFLGWNIHLHENDDAGEVYMDWIAVDIVTHPERWEVLHEPDGTFTAWRLVPQEDSEYETSDSEAYMPSLAEDEEF
ncbi:hypothetical protein WOLCODRAFT_133254 [Wolfiporia cocos MD-104 SS10]|uniref:RING-type domain-containing protein n=1 Tax=Wolfiporia cocos (strain MD-104) TaxID=742152 RepID=A0A2H3JSJ8_WOLCO|nr:hypothetical protein WOLCODRAFT_133254 [Wolfiporia cocos MD-104 SS10]